VKREDALDPTMNGPRHVRPEDLNIRNDLVEYKWEENDFLSAVKKRMNTKEWKQRLKNADWWFDFTTFCILMVHIFFQFVGVYYDLLPLPVAIVFFAITRTSLSGAGHYHCHRKKDNITNWADTLFDMQYVGASVTITDGHVMGHHMYTNTNGDVKRTIFTMMLDIPRLYRIPVYTI